MSGPSLFSTEFFDNPYPIYAALRQDDPVAWFEPLKAWIVTRHGDVEAGLKDAVFSSGSVRFQKGVNIFPEHVKQEARPFVDALSKMMLFLDEPEHRRLRAVVSWAFAPDAVEAMRSVVRSAAESLVSDLIDHVESDLMSSLAAPLPAQVIGQLLGASPESIRWLAKQADALAEFFGGMPPTESQLRAAITSTQAMCSFFADALRVPGGSRSALVNALASGAPEGEVLSEFEVAAQCTMLVFGGQETTRNLIGNGLLALVRNRDQERLLRNSPSCLSNAIEEFLRYDAPAQFMSRMASGDVSIAGRQIRAGQAVLFFIGSANRDEAVFTDPNKLDIRRAHNRHLSFGTGRHYCIGATLARMQSAEVFRALMERTLHLEIVGGEPQWHQNPNFRGLRRLDVHVTPVTSSRSGPS